MIFYRLSLFSLLVASCVARLQSGHTDAHREMSSLTKFLTDRATTINGTSTSTKPDVCLEDGTVCANDMDYTCDRCCNGAYEDNGKKCGGQCLESGTSCNEITIDGSIGTCNLCCNYTYFKTSEGKSNDSFECGCIKDGESCIPGETCLSCCNGAYDDNGLTCGGTCIKDGTECTQGEDCHLCCTGSAFWYSTGKMQCGTEPCYADGEECIPGQSCYNCCSGGAFDKDGTVCGGKCLPSGSNCSYLGSCNTCCQEEAMEIDSVTLPSAFPIGNSPHWNATARSMQCGYESCWEDGTDCIAGHTCYNCCNSSYAGTNGKCGGSTTCIESGAKCDYYGNCNSCCSMTSEYNKTLGYHVCANYDDLGYGYPMDDSTLSLSNWTVATSVGTSTMVPSGN